MSLGRLHSHSCLRHYSWCFLSCSHASPSVCACRRTARWESWDTHEMAATLSWTEYFPLIQSSLWAVECQTTGPMWLNYKLNSRLKGSSNKWQPRALLWQMLSELRWMMAQIEPSVGTLRGSNVSGVSLKSVSDGTEQREDPLGECEVRAGSRRGVERS